MTRAISTSSLFIGLAAGLTTALLFASATGGGMLALPLVLLAPLPLAIAGFGWGTITAVIASAIAAVAIGLGLGGRATIAFVLTDAVPVVLGAHLLGLARIVDPNDPSRLEWYPAGRAVAAVAAAIVVGTVVVGVMIGFDLDTVTTEMLEAYRQMAAATGGPDTAMLEPVFRATVRAIPALFPAMWFGVVVFDLWAAAKVVRGSGRMARPPEDWAALELPGFAGLAFVGAAAASFVGAPFGLVAEVVAGTLFPALFIVGAGILHTLARRSEARIIILAFVWGLVFVFSLPALLLVIAGALEPWVGLRRRFAAPRPS